MFDFLKNLFGGGGDRYETEKQKLKNGDVGELKSLAGNAKTHPEILYFLAKSENADIRRAVATNKATPVQAATLLANDQSVDVRQALAQRLCDLLPDLSPERQSQLYAYAVQALGMLAQDEVLSIRRALSSTLRDYAKAPPTVVSKLARDMEREVSEPILRFCVALPDDDLLDILASHPSPWVISAIAARAKVSEPVSEAVIDSEDIPGTTVLLNNEGAEIGESALQKIIDRARNYPEWHKPTALRPELSLNFARQLAGFVDEKILHVLEKRSDFDPKVRESIAAIVKRRLDFVRADAPNETAEDKIKRYVESKSLSAEVIQDALAWHDKDFALYSLSYLSGIHLAVVKKMISLGSARPVVALCWKAKLPMRVCIDVQQQLAKVDPRAIMYARGGTDYPLTDDEIKWQLEFFGVKA
jgi:uncharacterized protein (DUF2336 family)